VGRDGRGASYDFRNLAFERRSYLSPLVVCPLNVTPMKTVVAHVPALAAYSHDLVLRYNSSRRQWLMAALACVVTLAGVMSSPAALAEEAKAAGPGKLLIFRNIASWNRSPDFEDASRTLKLPFDVRRSSEMKSIRLADYRVIVIPGAQWETGYYADFRDAARAFDEYVQAGGVLLLELNGAENEGITLPGGATMVAHEGFENLVVMPSHPAVLPFADKPKIQANLASHGYLSKVPANALVMANVTTDGRTADKAKPTYVEYAHGKGRVIAACQCFHDRDGSGRGPLMPAALSYAMAGRWQAPK
jgi:hypothetical protein